MYRRHILIIEPSRTIRVLLSMYFRRTGHYTALFADYKDAIHALMLPTFEQEPPDLIFVALHPIRPTSFADLRRLRQFLPSTSTTIVALVTQEDSMNAIVQRAMSMLHVTMLVKPFTMQNALALANTPIQDTTVQIISSYKPQENKNKMST